MKSSKHEATHENTSMNDTNTSSTDTTGRTAKHYPGVPRKGLEACDPARSTDSNATTTNMNTRSTRAQAGPTLVIAFWRQAELFPL